MVRIVKRSLFLLASSTAAVGASMSGSSAGARQAADRTDSARARVVHLLSRMTYGPRPGEVDRVLAMGLASYITDQLHPESIPDPDADAYLRRLTLSGQSKAGLWSMFERERRERRERRARNGQADRTMERGSPLAGLRRAIGEFQQAHVARAVLSERQLLEVMVDFWTNHFNVFLGKGLDRILTLSYLDEAIRPYAMGRFEDLLLATARHPAMLFYLDNAQSVAAGAEPPFVARLRERRRRLPDDDAEQRERLDSSLARIERTLPRGVNENYARELLELHTLGVGGGYTQEDVEHVARILTGWSIRRSDDSFGFAFKGWAHDRQAKTVMGREFPAGAGMEEGVELLRFLAGHPATIRFVSGKLCRRFVGDDPPAGCVSAAAQAWRRSDGDIREILRAIFASPEFWSPSYWDAKLKTPLEFVVSAVRAVGGRPDTTLALAQVLRRLGQPLFLQLAPTGYPEREEAWVNSDALVRRLNLAVSLAAGRLPGVEIGDLPVGAERDPGTLVAAVNRVLLHGRGADHTLAIIRREAAATRDPGAARALAVGLALGSPAFQRQ